MDNMVFQNNNKNAIYVLNTNYNTYEELSRSSIFGYHEHSPIDEINNNSRSCSFSKSLHKLKSLRQNPSEMMLVGGSNAAEGNSSATTSSCSPAAAALQKLFNCSSTTYSCKNISHKSKNNNCHTNSQLHRNNSSIYSQTLHADQEIENLKEHMVQPQQNQTPLTLRGNTSAGCILNCVGGNGGSNGSNKKRYSTSTTSVKSTLIAKKTKFWKYLVEEEKWQKHSVESLSTTNCERNSPSSSEKPTLSSSLSSTSDNKYTSYDTAGEVIQTEQDILNNHSSTSHLGSIRDNSRISNWSGNIDTNETNSNSNQKSSAELYKEAAQLLGLSCTLCDNCRCLDCQSRYFECDDSDSYSEFSFMDDVDGSLKDLHSRHFSSQNLHSDQENSIDDTCLRTTYLNRNLLDHCNSFKNLSLGSSAESKD